MDLPGLGRLSIAHDAAGHHVYLGNIESAEANAQTRRGRGGMSIEVLPLKRSSICPCGYAVLKDEIQTGAKYRVDLATVRGGFAYRCGKCSTLHPNVTVVNANSILRPHDEMRPLPADLFL